MTAKGARRYPAAFALLAAWAVHDAEEYIRADNVERLRFSSPVDASSLRRAIPLMGAVVATASVRGWVTDGRSPTYQAAVAAFGLHGFSHLAISAVNRGYAPGVATVLPVVLPYAWWAWRDLAGRDRMSTGRAVAAGVAFAVTAVAGCHAATAGVTRRRRGLPPTRPR
ncbi:HXXEE domain-containing protein [Tsukamurella sp. 8F]|uniref:HXXEE domain-containing protein n=1 Tax=unclassified Tsukamurella TaxID=2633480 RepID=UPI0023B8A1B6|nr:MULTISPECIES: HXXEE domain-containing protein [unclassified Tsukamurella]MDF0531312.1 HXXEE domain-containing protein [Tsukamurella sp. 8J]MDF0585261.1 HXXEE domain-containing protein [Tsukamurella sp. 8F]